MSSITLDAVEMSWLWQLPRSGIMVDEDTVAKAQKFDSLRAALPSEVAE